MILARAHADLRTEGEYADPPSILDAPRRASVVQGTPAEVARALDRGTFDANAVRVVSGRAFNEYPSALALRRLLRDRGWREVPARPDLWARRGAELLSPPKSERVVDPDRES